MVIDEAKIDGKIIYSIAEKHVLNNFQSEIVELRMKIISDSNQEKENPETDTMIGKNVKMNEKM